MIKNIVLKTLFSFSFSFILISINPSMLYAQKTYEIWPDGEGLNSLQGVRDDIRRNHSIMNDNIIILINDGIYSLDSKLSFDTDDGGNDFYSVTYKAKDDSNPVFSGGYLIDNWIVDEQNPNIYKAQVTNKSVRNIYIDGERIPRSKSNEIFAEEVYKNNEEGIFGLIFDSKDIPEVGIIDGMEISNRNNWRHYYFVVDNIVDNNVRDDIPMGKSLVVLRNFNLAINQIPTIRVGDKDPYMFENFIEFKDEEEFYFQPSDQTIFLNRVNGNEKNCYVPDIECLVSVKSTHAEKRIKNLFFEGISFSYSSYNDPSNEGFFPLQGSHLLYTTNSEEPYKLIPGAIQIEDAENVGFRFCSFLHLGNNAISIINNTKGVIIENNTFKDISGTAISVSDYRHVSYDEKILPIINTTIRNNLIKDIGVEFSSCCGIEAFYVEDLSIANNELYELPYTGISAGFGWSKQPTVTKNVRILDNKIIGDTKKCFDGGAIYSLSHFGGDGLLIEGNYIDEITQMPSRDSQGAIYADEGSSNVRINNNVVKTYRKWFFFHKAGKVDVDSIYVLPDNHDVYGGVNDPAGGTEIQYIGNGEHIFDLPCELAEQIFIDSGIKNTESNESSVELSLLNISEKAYYKIQQLSDETWIIPCKNTSEGKISVRIFGVDGSIHSNKEFISNYPVKIDNNLKGLYIVTVSSESFSQIFKILL